MTLCKSKYEDTLKIYNMNASEIINKNVRSILLPILIVLKSFSLTSSVDYIVQTSLLIKESCHKYLTSYYEGWKVSESGSEISEK